MLDPVIHPDTRLKIMTALVELGLGTSITFSALQDTLGMTAGNLSVQARKLEQAGYVAITKSYQASKPVTYIGVTGQGEAAYRKYVATLKVILGM